MIDHDSLTAWRLDHAWMHDCAGQPSGTSERSETMTSSVRPPRTYSLYLEAEGGVAETITITVDAGTETEQDTAAERLADDVATAWMREGEWGDDGASVSCWLTMSDEIYEWPPRVIDVEIAPNDRALIERAIGPDDVHVRSCDHDWTSDGEGGCVENPGVWATGGTSMRFCAHCRHCGLRRITSVTGSQRNPGDHDTVRYEMAADDEIAYWRRIGAMDETE